jgi:thiol-disulfide isomerase/thioredoxin
MHLHGLQTALRLICFIVFSALWSLSSAAEPPLWIDHNAAGERQVHLYFFWSTTCPHCQLARPFVEALPAQHPWLVLHSREINSEPAASAAYLDLAQVVGENASSVPAFIYCGKMEVGFDHAETSGRALEASLRICHESTDANTGEAAPVAPLAAINLPILGQMTADQWSLPVFTLVIAGLDAFNPCAFFVLLFLLSLLVHAGSRGRMLFMGGVFLFFSGLIYFLFMAAWLNVFQWLGEIALVTTVAGWLAVIVAFIVTTQEPQPKGCVVQANRG